MFEGLAHATAHGGQKTTPGCWSSPSTTWLLRTNVTQFLGLVATTFTHGVISQPTFFLRFFIYLCMCLCEYMLYIWTWRPEDIGAPGAGVRSSCEVYNVGCWKLNSGPLGGTEGYILLSVQPSLQPLFPFCFYSFFLFFMAGWPGTQSVA